MTSLFIILNVRCNDRLINKNNWPCNPSKQNNKQTLHFIEFYLLLRHNAMFLISKRRIIVKRWHVIYFSYCMKMKHIDHDALQHFQQFWQDIAENKSFLFEKHCRFIHSKNYGVVSRKKKSLSFTIQKKKPLKIDKEAGSTTIFFGSAWSVYESKIT